MGGFIVDESTGVYIASWLRSEGHDAVSIREILPRLSDDLSSCFVVVTEHTTRVTRRGEDGDG